MNLTNNERSVLLALIDKSMGIGQPIAVYPFESELRKLSLLNVDGRLAIMGLQDKKLITFEEKVGFDDLRGRKASYPVYTITTEGFKQGLSLRAAEIEEDAEEFLRAISYSALNEDLNENDPDIEDDEDDEDYED